MDILPKNKSDVQKTCHKQKCLVTGKVGGISYYVAQNIIDDSEKIGATVSKYSTRFQHDLGSLLAVTNIFFTIFKRL